MTSISVTHGLEQKLARLGKSFTFDTETALAPAAFGGWDFVRLLQFVDDEEFEFYLDVKELETAERELLREFLQQTDLEITAHNAAFDYRVMLGCGIYLGGKPTNKHLPRLWDTMLASQVLYQGRANVKHNLAAAVLRELGAALDKTLQAQNWIDAVLTEADINYALNDVRWTRKLRDVLHAKVEEHGLWNTYLLETALIPSVVEMESTGMRLDPVAIGETLEHFEGEAEQCKQCFLETLDGRLQAEGLESLPRDEDGAFNTRAKDVGSIRLGTKKYAGFNINSAQQVLARFNSLGVEPVDDTGKPSLDKKVLARFQSDELVRMYRAYRNVEKRLGMAQKLVEHTDADHRIRARFMQLGTGTGRWSSSGPNLQNIPRDPEFRCAFRAAPGFVIIERDYDAMELRIAAAIAGEEKMLDAFNAGVDVHKATAALMYDRPIEEVTSEQRRASKSCSFGLLYGSGPKGLVNYFATVGLFISLGDGERFHRMWHAAYPAFGRWHRECQKRADAGEHMRTLIGRRRYLFGQDNKLTTQANNLVQGTGADCAKAAMVEIQRRLGYFSGAKLVATVHDSFLVECREQDAEEINWLMSVEMEEAGRSILGSAVPLTSSGGWGPSWGEAK